MLANGATLGYKKKGARGNYKILTGIKEIPELGDDPEKVENTGLADRNKQYEYGIGDAGELTYKFKYENTSECQTAHYWRRKPHVDFGTSASPTAQSRG